MLHIKMVSFEVEIYGWNIPSSQISNLERQSNPTDPSLTVQDGGSAHKQQLNCKRCGQYSHCYVFVTLAK